MRSLPWLLLFLTSCDAIKELVDEATSDPEDADGSPTDTGGDDDPPIDSGEPDDWTPIEFDEPDESIQYDYLPLTRLIDEGWILEDALELLPSAADALDTLHPDEEWSVAVEAGVDEGSETWIMLDPTIDPTLFLGDEPTLDPDGIYTVQGFASDGNGCVTTGYSPMLGSIEIESGDSLDGKKGGICVHLAVAHSLVNRLGVVSETWDDVIEGPGPVWVWSDKFLKALQQASGDTDDTRGKLPDETHNMHTADWNSGWEIVDSSYIEQADTSDQNEVWKWCQELKNQIDGIYEESGESRTDGPPADCMLTLNSATKGHSMYIDKVTWSQSDKKCSIQVVNTGSQDSKSNNYKNVKRNPGTQIWTVSTEGVAYAKGPKKGIWAALGFTTAEYHCWNKIRKEGTPTGPGSAMP